MTQPTASVGVDVDSLHHYYRIHGFSETGASNAAWDIAIPRFMDLFAQFGVSATFYCVAEDLSIQDNRLRIREMVENGHEIGNHSLTHPYALTRLEPQQIDYEVRVSREKLCQAAGVEVSGFRAPGYNTNSPLLESVMNAGHVYDTSIFSCAPYYLAKASVMGLMSLAGRNSASVLGSPKVMLAPQNPYVMDPNQPYKSAHDGLLQYPITVVGGVPMLGTAFTMLGPQLTQGAIRLACWRRRHVTVEFHAVDLLSLIDDSLDPQLAVQIDLKLSLERKRAVFSAAMSALTRYARVRRLDDIAHSTLK